MLPKLLNLCLTVVGAGWVCSRYHETFSASVRGPAPPTVGLTVVLKANSAVSGRFPGALQALRTRGWWVSWGLGDRLRAMSRRAPEPSPRLPAGRAQALRQQRASPPSPPLPPNGGGCLHGWQPTEASATGVDGHCHPGNRFSQLQSLCSSFKNWPS